MGELNFPKDLAMSQIGVEKVKKYFESKGYKVTLNHDYRFDMTIESPTGWKNTIEMKEDIKTEVTGNVAIEFECRGKLSGIKVTEANLWVQRIHSTRDYIKEYII